MSSQYTSGASEKRGKKKSTEGGSRKRSLSERKKAPIQNALKKKVGKNI